MKELRLGCRFCSVGLELACLPGVEGRSVGLTSEAQNPKW